jgi:hypothetical protein
MLELRPCPPVGECVCAASPARNTRPTLNCSTIRTFGLHDVLSEAFLGNAAHRGVLVGSKVGPADELNIWAADEALQESAHCGGVCRKRLRVGHITAADNHRPTVAARDARRTDERAAGSVSAAPSALQCDRRTGRTRRHHTCAKTAGTREARYSMEERARTFLSSPFSTTSP